MNIELLNYGIRSTTCLAFFYVFYSLILSKETCFKFNRGYLLATLILGITLPLVRFSFQLSSDNPIDPNTFLIPEVIITNTAIQQTNLAIDFYSILNTVYLLIAILLVSRLLYRLYQLWTIVNSNRHLHEEKYIYKIVPTNGKISTSSFLDYLFWDNTNPLNEGERNQIISHEKVHILERHSYDILLVEFISIIFWFNPFIWLWKKAVIENHEYIADAKASQQRQGYADFLARHTLAINGFDIIHQFKSSEVLKRFNMLKKIGRKTRLIKIIAVISLSALMVVSMSFSVEKVIDQTYYPATTSTSNDKDDKDEKESTYTDAEEPLMKSEVYFSSDIQETIIPHEVKPKPIPSSISELKPVAIPVQKEDEKVFNIVEESASPINGMTAFYSYLATNIKYPKQAKKNNIAGRVFVEFVIDKKGAMTELKVVKGIGAGCDQEALRVLSKAPKWNPGKQRGKAVKQKIVLPIVFELG